VSTRLIGGVIMTHGDDDGLRVPPAIAPWQVVILPMLRDNDGDAALLAYCENLRREIAGQSALGEQVRVLLDKKPGKAAAKRWDWVRKGVPVILEVGGRDMENGKVSLLRRDRLWGPDAKPAFEAPSSEECTAGIAILLSDIQTSLYNEARERRDANITRGVETIDDLADFFTEKRNFPGWVEVQWSKPTGAALEKVVEQLKALKLTVRNVPMDAQPADGRCLFTGEPAVERIFVARSY